MNKKFLRNKLSVIVPIYNVEEYLIECLDSINNQTLKNIQVILIDNGSTDNSRNIAVEYAKTHSNFEYHRIENQGLGYARNYAMQFVKAKYFAYIDSDDFLDKDIYRLALQKIKKTRADVAIFNVARCN